MRSMTGFGHATVEEEGRRMTVEIKGVNHRFLDVSFRMPRSFSFLENKLRSMLSDSLGRGHVDVFINYSNTREDARNVEVNEGLMAAYQKAFEQISEKSGLRNDLTAARLSQYEGVLVITENEDDPEAITNLAQRAMALALEEMCRMRSAEGEQLKKDLLSHVAVIEDTTQAVMLRAPVVVQEYRDKLAERIAQYNEGLQLDENRLVQEVALFADRVAVDEETSRLLAHCKAVRDVMEEEGSIGRRLDFIVQEMNREANTTGSKSSDLELLNHTVTLKSEIEKLREQVQNVE
ncbi:MAG: YicC family protein [Clostridia bacterium]|nr:YicC family protein [Clostridia bacterium]